jgi:hypothetical protein
VKPELSSVELAILFASIGRQLASFDRTDTVFRALCATAVERVPGGEFAGVTIGQDGAFKTVGATSDLVHKADRIQYDLRSGPCVDAIVHDTVFDTPDLRSDRRWPEFGRQAFDATGIVSMLSLRLYVENDHAVVAALNMYSTQPAAFGEPAATIALLLATHGAIAVSNAAARERAANLEKALENSREIGVAMGIVMHQQKTTRDQAFDLLRIASQHTHRKIAEIAAEVADTGQLPNLPLRTSETRATGNGKAASR